MDYKNNGLNYDRLRNAVDEFFNLVKIDECVGVCDSAFMYVVIFCEK